jgi:hypothetical protein
MLDRNELIKAAFLLNNTVHYNLAHALGLLEYFVSSYFFPGKYDTWICSFPVISAGKWCSGGLSSQLTPTSCRGPNR